MVTKKTRQQRAKAKREKRTRLVMTGIIVFLMVASSAAFALLYYSPQQSSDFPYTVTEEGLILARLEGREVIFYSLPDDSVVLPENFQSQLKNVPLIVTSFDPSLNESLPYLEQARFDLSQHISTPQQSSVLTESSLYPSLPVGGCEFANNSTLVLSFVNGTRDVQYANNCVQFFGNTFDFLVYRDQILYEYYGVR